METGKQCEKLELSGLVNIPFNMCLDDPAGWMSAGIQLIVIRSYEIMIPSRLSSLILLFIIFDFMNRIAGYYGPQGFYSTPGKIATENKHRHESSSSTSKAIQKPTLKPTIAPSFFPPLLLGGQKKHNEENKHSRRLGVTIYESEYSKNLGSFGEMRFR